MQCSALASRHVWRPVPVPPALASSDGAAAAVSISLTASAALSLVEASGARVLYPGLHFLDVWDGGANNVTLAVEVPGGAGEAPRVVRQPPPLPPL